MVGNETEPLFSTSGKRWKCKCSNLKETLKSTFSEADDRLWQLEEREEDFQLFLHLNSSQENWDDAGTTVYIFLRRIMSAVDWHLHTSIVSKCHSSQYILLCGL